MNNIINKENFGDCCEYLNDKVIFIKDDKTQTCFISTENDFDIKITNENQYSISFLKVDKCVFDDSDDEKCDCCVANQEKIYFAEIKEVENFELHKPKLNRRKKAKNQLSSTINEIKNRFPDMDMKKVFAVIVLLPKFEDKYLKPISTKDQTVIAEFFEKCGCPNIYEGNEINF